MGLPRNPDSDPMEICDTNICTLPRGEEEEWEDDDLYEDEEIRRRRSGREDWD